MYKPTIEDLQYDLLQIKKRNCELQSENQLHKVKIRKLSDEILKKNKQLDILLDPKKCNSISRALTGHGASLIMGLKEENCALQRKLADRELLVKKLQTDLDTTKLYLNEKSKLATPFNQENFEKVDELSSGTCCSDGSTARSNIKPRSKSVNPGRKQTRCKSPRPATKESLSAIDLQKDCAALLTSNLQRIKQSGGFSQRDKSNRSVTPVRRDAPHEEIQQLQGYLFNVLTEVDCLKNTIRQLQKEQTKTTLVLSDKNSDINKLVTEIASFNKQSRHCKSKRNRSEKPESACTEPMSTDVPSTDYDSDCNDPTERSVVRPKLAHKHESADKKKCYCRSVSIQTTKSFCTHTFTPPQARQGRGKATCCTGTAHDMYVEHLD